MKILVADDNHFYRRALEATIAEWGYEVVSAHDGQSAWEILRSEQAPKLAILDWMMPGMDGLEVCRRVRNLSRPEPTYLIVLTAKGGKENIITALESGADDYITKPFDREELRARLKVGARIVSLQTSQTVVFTFARAVEAKSPYTQGHADRVMSYALLLAHRLGLDRSEQETLRWGAILHDIGKICIPETILNKPSSLTPEEYAIFKQHPLHGVKIVEPLQSLQNVVPLIRWHHERLDGTGYPDGLAGDAIPLLVRILSIADVYDALNSARPYRPSMAHEQCLDELRRSASHGGLDPQLVDFFCDALRTPEERQPSGPVVDAQAAADLPLLA